MKILIQNIASMGFKIFLVFLGGGIGSSFRYGLSLVFARNLHPVFPIATLSANIAGALIIGFLWGISQIIPFSGPVKLFFLTGLLGGFTTFSSFMLESMNQLLEKEFFYFFLYISLTFFLGLIFVFGGYILGKLIIRG